MGQTTIDRAPVHLQDSLIQYSDTLRLETQSYLSFQLSASDTYQSKDKYSDEDTIILKSTGDSESERLADDVIQTFATFKTVTQEQTELKQWLEERNLEEAYEPLVISKYGDLEILLKLTKASQLTADDLKTVGIQQPGIRERLILRLEQATGLINVSFLTSPSFINASTQTSCTSCYKSSIPAAKSIITYTQDLSEWLSEIDLEHLYPLFIATGYNHFDDLLLLAYAKESKFFQNLLIHLGIEKKSYRVLILNSLKKELNRRMKYEFSTLIENNSSSVVCSSCELL